MKTGHFFLNNSYSNVFNFKNWILFNVTQCLAVLTGAAAEPGHGQAVAGQYIVNKEDSGQLGR